MTVTPLPLARSRDVSPLRESCPDVAVVLVDRELLDSQGLELLVECASDGAVRLQVLAADRTLRHRERIGHLTTAERRLWRLVADGLDTAEIAKELFVSERTAKRRVAALLDRLGVSSRIQAATLAGRCGLLETD